MKTERHSKKSPHNRQTKPFFRSGGTSSFFSPSTSVQPKLTIGQVGDPFEREADHVADQVMRSAAPSVQRVCEACEEEEVHRMPDLQLAGNEVGEGSRDLVSLGAGQPMSSSERSFFEPRFNRNFEHVRIHQGTSASQKAASINAKAYTHQNNIVFGAGQYNPSSNAGRRLMAHELTHTIQQGASSNIAQPTIQRDEFVPYPGQIGQDLGMQEVDENTNDARGMVLRRGDPAYDSNHRMLLQFDAENCVLTVTKQINFVRAGTGENQLSQEDFDALKARILLIAREQLNGWVTINVSGGEECGLECVNGQISVNVVTTEGTGRYSSTLNLHPTMGRENAGNIGDNASDRTIWHELGHIVLGAADEYQDSGRPGGPRPPSRVNTSDWSIMGDDAGTRRSLMHARHFSHLPAWLERRFPDCNFTLNETSRPLVVEFTPYGVLGGYASFAGDPGIHYSLGFDFGIPFDRLRRLEFILGPRLNLIYGSDLTALLLGFRAGLEGQTSSSGLRFGGYVEGGGVGFSDLSAGALGAIPYVEGTLGLGYSVGSVFNIGGEAGVGGREVPNLEIPGASTFGGYFRFGLNLGGNF